MLNLLWFRILCLMFFYINFTHAHTQNPIENSFCNQIDKYGETGNTCNFQTHYSKNRYILYDIYSLEGFNLRRDVYIRVAVFIKNLMKHEKEFNWKLVLPPWGNLHHWRTKNIGSQIQLPWSLFFDITSLQKYISVIEMYQFLQEYSSIEKHTLLDVMYILKNDEEMFKTGKFEDKNEIIECTDESLQYNKLESARYFWGYHNISFETVKCIKFHGMISDLKRNLKPNIYRSVMFDHMEIALHDFYGSQEYWTARRSMRYNSELYRIANVFREDFLNSTDKTDNTERPSDWTQEKNRRNALGGPYLATHLRRRDFVFSRRLTIPTIKSAAFQLKEKLDTLGLKLLFVATDATEEEFSELKKYLFEYTVLRFIPSDYVLNKYKDGGVAIIDQIICSYARYFMGTYESTFTFRIQEDREIIGFLTETTFNVLCNHNKKCSSTGQWEIVW